MKLISCYSIYHFSWIKFNPGQTGFYRVKYPPKYYEGLSNAIKNLSLSSMDRLGVQNDVVALTKSGDLNTRFALEILRSYSNETNYTVWSGVSTNLSTIWGLIRFEDWSLPLKNLARELYSNIGKKLDWEPKKDESHLDTLLRSVIIEQLGLFDDLETIRIAKEKFKNFIKDNSSVSPDLRGALYSIVLKNGGEDEFNQILEIYNKTTLNEEKVRILGSLGSYSGDLQKLINWAFSDAVKRQDSFYIFGSISSNVKGRDIVWKFFQDNIDEFVKRYSGGLNFLSHFVKISTRFTSFEKAEEVEKFFEKHPIPEANMAIKQVIENIKTNAAWLKRETADLKEYLLKFK